MSDPAAHILREAKSLNQTLKESLKNRDIADKEIEILRKNLRRQYLRLLFVHPYARESKDAETALWVQTSYALISIYKARIAALDRAIQHPPRQGQQQSNHPPRTVEYRKLLQRFRQFLAEEEKFWTQLVLRIHRHFAPDDAQSTITALGIAFEDDQAPPSLLAAAGDVAPSANASRRNQFQFPPELDAGALDIAPTSAGQRESRIAILSKALVYLGDIARYKEQYNESGGRPRAGHEDGPPAAASRRGRRGGGPAGHVPLPRLRNYDRAQSCYEQARLLLPHDGNPSHQLAILSSYQKDTFSSLVHYYRALCVRQPFDTASENMGNLLSKTLETYKNRGLLRERELQEEIVSGGKPTPRVRVEAFKEKVVVLHSLWCTNVDDAKPMGERVVRDFADLVADRILPIDMISKVVILAQGALWKHRMVRRPGHNNDRRHSKTHNTESNIVTHLVATHRVLLTNGSVELTESPPEDAADHDLAQRITATFRRTLPALRMAGKWLRANTRYISQARRLAANANDSGNSNGGGGSGSGSNGRGRDNNRRHNTAPPVVVGDLDAFWSEYARFCTTLLRLFPLEELPKLKTQLEEDVEMAGFLPLRKFMMGPDGRAMGTGSGVGSGSASSRMLSPREMTAGSAKVGSECNNSDGIGEKERPMSRDQVHPNEEQLMRISDILNDAQAIAEDENTPTLFEEGVFVFKGEPVELASVRRHEQAKPAPLNGAQTSGLTNSEHSPTRPAEDSSRTEESDDDSVSSIAIHNEEDRLLREAFDVPLSDPSEGEEKIVYSPPKLSPRHEPVVTSPSLRPIPNPITPPRMNLVVNPGPVGYKSPPRADPLSAARQPVDAPPQLSPPRAAPTSGTTADKLLEKVLGRPPGTPQHTHARGASVPRIGFSFGSGLGGSIWSTDTGDSPARPYAPPHNLQSPTSGSPYPPPVSRPTAPSLPPAQRPWVSQPAQTGGWPPQGLNIATYAHTGHLGSSLGSPFAPEQPSINNGGHGVHHHQRSPSDTSALLPRTTATYSQPGPTLAQQQYDPFGYDIRAPLVDTIGGMPTNGMLGRAPEQQLPSPSGPAGYGYPTNHIESAFYNAPNIEPSASSLRRDRLMTSPQYDRAAHHIWGNSG